MGAVPAGSLFTDHKKLVLARFAFALKGHGFSRADKCRELTGL
jgi:hypothetical protein